MSSKPQIRAHRRSHLHLPLNIRHIIQITLRILRRPNSVSIQIGDNELETRSLLKIGVDIETDTTCAIGV